MKKIASFWRSLPAHERYITLPTSITLLRIILAPILVILMCTGYWVAAFCVFIFAAITDVLDGALARAWHQQTLFGACLDPVADKIFLISCFSVLALIKTPFFVIPYWFVWLILTKEITLMCGVIFLYTCTGIVWVEPTRLGKTTTFIQICFIAWLFVCYFCSWVPTKTYWISLSLLFCLIVVSFAQYIKMGIRVWKLR